MGSKAGALRAAAKRLGLTVEEYEAKRAAGFKHCRQCRQWKTERDFCRDTSRGDGLASACTECRNVRLTDGPGKSERQAKRAAGLAWCRRCEDWLPAGEVRQGLCRPHANQEARERYAADPNYRAERRQHARSRARTVKPLATEAMRLVMDMFGGLCVYCGAPATTWDHVLAISQGGDTDPGNIVPACARCNSRKKDRDFLTFIAENNLWDDHLMLQEAIAMAVLTGHAVP